MGPHAMSMAHHVYGVGGAQITDGTDFFDPIDRLVIRNVNESGLLGTYSRTEARYDSLGRQSQQAAPCTFTAVANFCTYWTTTTYDVLNRVTQVQRPISASNNSLQTTIYQYAGDTVTITDPQSNARTLVRDPNGWMRQTQDPAGYRVTTGYDAAGSSTSVTDNQSNTLWSGSYAYGIAPFLIDTHDMDRGDWGYSYDALGEMTAWQDGKNQPFSATYDALSRMTSRTEPDFFTQWTWGSSLTSHNIGKLQSACVDTVSPCSGGSYYENYSFDSLGRPLQQTTLIPATPYGPAGTFTYSRQYNATTGLLSTLTYPTSTSGYALTLQYGYQNGILQSITNVSDSPNVPVWQANAINAAGQITQETLGNSQFVTNRTYDAVTHWLSSVQSGPGGSATLENQGFLYDLVGNVTQRQDNNLGLSENLFYDSDYRLYRSTLNGTQNLSISYDLNGNITSRSDVASGATWTYDTARKHAVLQAGSSGNNYAYDANGNAITRQGSSITWWSSNYPQSISAGSGSTAESVFFGYGPGRQRDLQVYSGNGISETTYYVGKLLEVVYNGSSVDYRHYIYAGSRAVAIYHRSNGGTNAFNFLLADHQGSVASVVNSAGSTVVSESFTPFGNRRNPATWAGTASTADLTTAAGISRQGYTFQTQLGLWMGLNHMNGRVQDAMTGRFLSADPTIPDPQDAQSYNRYSYALNNPLTFMDPTGFGSTDQTNDQREQGDMSLWGFASFGQPHGSSYGPAHSGAASGNSSSGSGGGGSSPNIATDGQSSPAAAQSGSSQTAQSPGSMSVVPITGRRPSATDTMVDPYFESAFDSSLAKAFEVKPSFWERALAFAKAHPLVATAVVATVILGGGPEDPFSDTAAAAEVAATEGASGAVDSVVVIGRQIDTAVAKDWAGHTVLDLPASEWSIEVNDAFIQGAIDARQTVYLASPTTEANLFNAVAGRATVFGRELQQLFEAGYTRAGDYLVPRAP